LPNYPGTIVSRYDVVLVFKTSPVSIDFMVPFRTIKSRMWAFMVPNENVHHERFTDEPQLIFRIVPMTIGKPYRYLRLPGRMTTAAVACASAVGLRAQTGLSPDRVI
jgi:hypothetical protein